jgi:flagellar biosynthesis protein FlhG
MVPGVWAPDKPQQPGEGAQRRLLAQLAMLGRHADVVVIDGGARGGELPQRFWQAADDVLLVTTPESMSVMDTYATIKTLRPPHDAPRIWLAVNRADAEQAQDVHRRVDQSCRRFLETSTRLLGSIADDESFAASAEAAAPLVIHAPLAPATVQIERLAAELMSGASRPPHITRAAA